MEDSQIVLLIKNRSSEGLYEAIKKYRNYTGAIVSRILNGNGQDIEECIDDTFVSAWKYILENNEVKNLKGCIACIARNTAINRYKKLVRQSAVNIDDLKIASESNIVLEFEHEGNALAVQKLVNDMDEPDREIFVRKYFLLESIKEISKKTLLDETQIKNRLYRGRQRLRKQLEERNVTL